MEEQQNDYDSNPDDFDTGESRIKDEREEIMTAFTVIIDTEGMAVALMDSRDLEKFKMQRAPKLQDIWRGCAEVAKDVESTETAQRALQQQMQMAQQIQQQQGGGKGLHVPRS